jgi:hypothetical protein
VTVAQDSGGGLVAGGLDREYEVPVRGRPRIGCRPLDREARKRRLGLRVHLSRERDCVRSGELPRPHDDAVLPAVRVVSRASADGAEAGAFVERDRLGIGGTHLEREAGEPAMSGLIDQGGEQGRTETATASVGPHGKVHHVSLVGRRHKPRVPEQSPW